MTVEIGGSTIESGASRWIDLTVVQDADGQDIVVPIRVINGDDEGPKFWMQGCVHGDEQVGGWAVQQLLSELSPSDVTGTIIAAPVANTTAFRSKSRESPIDQKDLNRIFPGDESGTVSEQLAAVLFELATEHADRFVGMHSAGDKALIDGFSVFITTDDGTEETAREMCRAAGFEDACGLDPDGIEGMMCAELAVEEIPAILIECGGSKDVPTYRSRSREALRKVLQGQGILDGTVQHDSDVSFHTEDYTFVGTSKGGFYSSNVDLLESVDEGDQLGTVTSLRGELIEEVTAPHEGKVIDVRTNPVANPGDLAALVTR